jgi:hypothetical protein
MNKTFTGNEGNRNQVGDLLYGLIVQREVRQTVVSLGAAATKLPTTPIQYRKSLQIFNNSGDIIYLGNSTVTVLNGYPLYPRASINIQIEDGIDLYGISAGAASDIRILEGS